MLKTFVLNTCVMKHTFKKLFPLGRYWLVSYDLLSLFFFFILEINNLTSGNLGLLGRGALYIIQGFPPLFSILYLLHLSWLDFTADFSGDQNGSVSPPAFCCSVLL